MESSFIGGRAGSKLWSGASRLTRPPPGLVRPRNRRATHGKHPASPIASREKPPDKKRGRARLFSRLSRPTAGPQSRLQSQTFRRLFYPTGAAERRATVHASPHRLQLGRRQSLIDPIEPTTRPTRIFGIQERRRSRE